MQILEQTVNHVMHEHIVMIVSLTKTTISADLYLEMFIQVHSGAFFFLLSINSLTTVNQLPVVQICASVCKRVL